MTVNKLKGFVFLGTILAVIGFILLFFSVDFGKSQADNWLVKQGVEDTSIYLIMIKSYINNFLVGGSILFGVGLVTFIFSFYKILKIKG